MPGYQTDNFYNLDSIIKYLKNVKESYLTTKNHTYYYHVYYTLSKISLDIAIKQSNVSSIRYLKHAKYACSIKEFDDAINYVQQLLLSDEALNENDDMFISYN